MYRRHRAIRPHSLWAPALLALGLTAAPAGAQGTPPAAAGAPATAAAPGINVPPPAWLAGCWELRAGARVTHEQWMASAGGVMLGMSRTVVRDTVREWEHLYLGPRAGGLAYVARPVRQAETAFGATAVNDTMAVFENLAHDFPQRIIYRRRGADSVVARIEGPRNGQLRGLDFPMRRVSCP